METILDEDINLDAIDACRICGIYYIKTFNLLRNIFSAHVDDPQMHQIRLELAAWKLEITKDDGRPQNICMGCINEFQRVFKFRESCMEAQKQFEYFEQQRQQNNAVTIKTELPDPNEQNICSFIYIDDLSDTEDDGQLEGSLVPNFNGRHIPIKEEHIEEAKVPKEVNHLPSTITPEVPTCTDLPAMLKTDIKLECSEEKPVIAFGDNLANLCADEDDDVEIVKFTYNDDDERVEEAIYLQNKSSNSKENESVCKFCLHVAKDPEALRLHVQRIHDVKDFECHICGKIFKNSTAARLKFHVKWHKLSKHIKCSQCGFYCTNREVLDEHTRAMHTKIKCNICGKRMIAKRLKGHLREHEHIAPFRCTMCMKVFDNQLLYETHVSHSHRKTRTAADQTLRNPISDHIPTHLHSTLSESRLTDNLTASNSFETNNMGVDWQRNQSKNLDTSDKSEPFQNSSASITKDCSGAPVDEKSKGENINQTTESESTKVNDSTLSAYSEHDDRNRVCHFCGKTFDLTFKLNRHMQKHTKS